MEITIMLYDLMKRTIKDYISIFNFLFKHNHNQFILEKNGYRWQKKMFIYNNVEQKNDLSYHESLQKAFYIKRRWCCASGEDRRTLCIRSSFHKFRCWIQTSTVLLEGLKPTTNEKCPELANWKGVIFNLGNATTYIFF